MFRYNRYQPFRHQGDYKILFMHGRVWISCCISHVKFVGGYSRVIAPKLWTKLFWQCPCTYQISLSVGSPEYRFKHTGCWNKQLTAIQLLIWETPGFTVDEQRLCFSYMLHQECYISRLYIKTDVIIGCLCRRTFYFASCPIMWVM